MRVKERFVRKVDAEEENRRFLEVETVGLHYPAEVR